MLNQKPAGPDTKNLFLAMVLSMAILFGWQMFFQPAPKKVDPAAPQQTQTQVVDPAATQIVPRGQVLAAAPRVVIDTPSLEGSINLKGAQIDDLKLKKFHETVQADSPIITFLSPSGAKDAYFAEQGLLNVQGQTAVVPDAKTLWVAASGAKLTEAAPLDLTYDNGAGMIFHRTISISDDYVFTVKQSVENKTSSAASFQPYGRIQRQDTPHVQGYSTFFEGLLGVQDGKLTEANYSGVAKENGKIELVSTGGWLGFTDKYWSTALLPAQGQKITSTYQHFKQGERDAYQTSFLSSDPLIVAPGATGVYEDHVFAGAKIVDTVNKVGSDFKIDKFDLMIDWGWFKFLTQPMFKLLEFAKGIMGNFALAILLVTVIVKAVLFPLANRSYASMSRMKKLQPKMEEIKAKYPDDKMKQQQEIMAMYKTEKVSPLAGCVPMFIQIPIFFSLYKVILTTIDLRHAPFYGWIHDLSVPDPTSLFNLFGLLPFTPPAFLIIGVWPLLMGCTMWVQMRLNPAPADPVQASLFNWMPIMFTYMLSSMPAGLVIYWTWSNLLSILQQSYIMKKNGTEVNILGNIRDSIPFLKKKTAAPT
jgi:YidC/Oxa1 family membrane protein insertase